MGAEVGYGSTTLELFESVPLNTSSSKTCTISCLTALESLCKTWPKSGMIRLGRSSTPNSAACHKEGVEFTYWDSVMESPQEPTRSTIRDVLLMNCDPKLMLSNKSAIGILRRALERNIPLPSLLANALTNMLSADYLEQLRNETTKVSPILSYMETENCGELELWKD